MNFLKLLAKWFADFFKLITPDILELIKSFCKALKEAADKTDNPWDDILADLFCKIFGEGCD